MMRHAAPVPAIAWAADGPLFLPTAGLFPPEFLRGAAVLLASYDREPAPATAPAHDSATA